MNDPSPKRKIDVDELAAGNPAINVPRFKRWREKMNRIEQIRANRKEPQDRSSSPPRREQEIQIGRFRRRSGILLG